MPLTEAQANFIERYIKIPFLLNGAAKEKRKEWASEFEQFNARRDSVQTRVATLDGSTARSKLMGQLAKIETALLSADGNPDFAGAMDQLDVFDEAFDIHKEYEDTMLVVASVEPVVQTILQTVPYNADQITTALDRAKEAARSGASDQDPAKFDDARKIVRTIAPLIKDAEDQTAACATAAKTAQALQQAKDNAVKDLGGGVPDAMGAEIDAVALKLTTVAALPVDQVLGIVDDAGKFINGMDGRLQSLLADSRAYNVALGVFEGACRTLYAHPQKAEPTFMVGIIAAIGTESDAAKEKASKREWATATTDLKALTVRCNDGIKLGDDIAQYQAVLKDRKDRAAPLGDPSAAMEGAPRNKVTEAKGHITTAETEFAAGKTDKDPARIAAATATLSKVPAAVDEAQQLLKYSAMYKSLHADNSQQVEAQKTYPTDYKTHMASDILLFAKLFAEATIADTAAATTANFKTAAVKLTELRTFRTHFYNKQALITAYLNAKKACKDRWNEFNNLTVDTGRNAVEGFIVKTDADYKFAEALVASPATANFGQATDVMNSSKSDHEKLKKDVPFAKDFKTREKAITPKITAIKTSTSDWAEEAADAVTALLTSAQAQALTRNWSSALTILAQAEARLTTAQGVGQTVKGFTAVANDVSAEAPDAALAQFEILRAKVAAADPGDFAGQISNANTLANEGKTLGDSSKIDAAIGDCLKIGTNIAHKAQYDTVYSIVKQAHETDIPALNTDANGCIASLISTIGTSKVAAENLAAAGSLKFVAAIVQLGNAEKVIAEAKEIVEKWKTNRDRYFEIKAVSDGLNTPEKKAVFNDEYQRLLKFTTDCWAKMKAGKISEAIKLIDEMAPYAKGVKKESDYLVNFNIFMAGEHRTKRTTVDESTAKYAKAARDAIAKFDPEITGFKEAKLIEQAWRHALRLETEITRGLAIQKAAEDYFAAKTAAADALKAYEAKNSFDNTLVRDKLDELNSAFGLASVFDSTSEVDSWEAEEKYTSGLRALKPIPDECAKLDAAIKAFDDCQTEREKAGKAIGEVLKSGNKDIAGLAERLRGKHAAAVTEMNGGEYDTAISMFKELVADAAKAALTATEIGGVLDEINAVKAIKDDEDLSGPIETARKKLAELRQREGNFAATTELDTGDKAVIDAEAKATDDKVAAKAHIVTAMEQASAALRLIELARQFMAATEYATAFLNTLDAHAAGDFIKSDTAGIRQRLAALINAVRSSTTTASVGTQQAEVMMTEAHAAHRVANAHIEYLSQRLLADKSLADMENAKSRYAIRDQIQSVRDHIAEADGHENERKHDDAMRALKRIMGESAEALLTARLETGSLPKDATTEERAQSVKEIEAQIATVLGLPGGDKKIDALVAKLDPKTDKGVLIAVMKLRFGCEMEVFKRSPDTVDQEYKEWLITTNTAPDGVRVTRMIGILDEAGAKGKYDTWLLSNATATEAEKKTELEKLIKANGAANTSYRDWLADSNQKSGTDKKAEKDRRDAENKEDRFDETAPNLQKMFAAMAMCPSSDTLGNDSMLVLSTSGGVQTGSAYSSGLALDGTEVKETKKVLMREGDVGNSSFYGVALPFELDEIDPKCVPEENVEPMSMFSWNTLHEVGHAVDDKKGIMKGTGKTFAGWESHGANVVVIAKEAAKDENFGYDANYIAAYLSGTKEPPIPSVKGKPNPTPAELEDWERKRLKVVNWCDSLRVGKKPWSSAAIAKSIALKNGRVYHESYEGDWYSYDVIARKEGISGYQFRAPGEWFSELYAAYHSGKMNKSHPRRDFIANL